MSAYRLPVSHAELADRLVGWFRREQRDLPWRQNPEPYWVWLSEVMLQQTTVKAVLPFFEKFVRKYPTLQDLAWADSNEVLSDWSGLGYYSRARNLQRAARRICAEHQGRFPSSYDVAIGLPGIGRYTAGAVLSIAYGLPFPIVDGNIKRVMARFLLIEEVLTGKSESELWALLSDWVGRDGVRERISEFNQSLMEVGALVCTPRKPKCPLCPLQEACLARANGRVEELPRRPPRRKVEEISFQVAVIARGSRFLLRQNREETFLKGFWEFPRIDASPGEDVTRSFREVHGLELSDLRPLSEVQHRITFRKLTFRPYLASLEGPVPETRFAWARLDEAAFPVPAYVRKIESAASRPPIGR